MNDIITALNWRFATKVFDTTKKVSAQDLQQVLDATRLTPSSLGLQPYHVVVVSDPVLRKELQVAAYDQAQITDASHTLVFCARTDLQERGQQLLDSMSGGKPEELDKLAGLKGMINGSIAGKSESELVAWAGKQAYIALGVSLTTLALMKIDSCPMEGFDNVAFDRLLELPAHIKSAAVLAIGYRAVGPAYPKVRFPAEELFSWRK